MITAGAVPSTDRGLHNAQMPCVKRGRTGLSIRRLEHTSTGALGSLGTPRLGPTALGSRPTMAGQSGLGSQHLDRVRRESFLPYPLRSIAHPLFGTVNRPTGHVAAEPSATKLAFEPHPMVPVRPTTIPASCARLSRRWPDRVPFHSANRLLDGTDRRSTDARRSRCRVRSGRPAFPRL